MSEMEIAGYIAALVIGISLGLIGGGGSSLAVPVLVYLFRIPPQQAIPDSLFIVGLASLVGAISYLKNKQVSFKSLFVFGLPSVCSVYFTRAWLAPAIPQHLDFFGRLTVSKDIFVLVIFSVLMVAASFSMIRPLQVDKTDDKSEEPSVYPYLYLILAGICIGFLAGLVGAGGGFLIIPALVVLARLPMKMAIGTSLLIISINSGIGFLSDLGSRSNLNWPFLLAFTALAVAGIFAGTYISKFIQGSTLKPAFGWFILALGGFIISQQIIQMNS